jgi:hypothetical protein
MSDSHDGQFEDPLTSHPHIKREPIIKNEVLDEELLAKIEEAEVDDPDFDETEGLLADYEGATYYLDGEFKIKQVPAAGVVRRTIEDFASKYRTPSVALET